MMQFKRNRPHHRSLFSSTISRISALKMLGIGSLMVGVCVVSTSWAQAVNPVAQTPTQLGQPQGAPQNKQIAVVLQAIDLNQVPKWNAPYEFRIASFAKDEGGYGSGALVLLLSNDLRTAYVNLQGVTTELKSVQKNPSTSCRSGDIRQSVYANADLRLMLKVSLEPGEEACWAKGVVSLHLNKHTYRYMVKGVSGL
ncbi:hypothetical protein RF679_16860 [Undibacterium cyanobacteriorum]|uniref:Uncharacterized protein n=1 Tax=Undibacterium cyanobacteriorum TaxID=3073561 RepID=A0ABY9RGE0_9BURK|nr:hypothetical protein [Undibacterium sp. 20NA77.5]WMW80298.1 hypothetical protein RF679_16860 [Undibacterium sp. 20NA77.5]